MSLIKLDLEIQFNELYKSRIKRISELILENSSELKDIKLLKLNQEIKNRSMIIGILFLISGIKKSILNNKNIEISNLTYMSGHESFYIEDEYGRIPIIFKETCNKPLALITGIVLGFIREINESGIFVCDSIIYPKDINSNENTNSDKIDVNDNNSTINNTTNTNTNSINTTINTNNSSINTNNSTINKSILILNNAIIKNSYAKLKILFDTYQNKISDVIFIGKISLDERFDEVNYFLERIKVPVYIIKMENNNEIIPIQKYHKLLFSESAIFIDKEIKRLNCFDSPSCHEINNKNFIFCPDLILNDMVKYIPQGNGSPGSVPSNYDKKIDLSLLDGYSPLNYKNLETKFKIVKEIIDIRHLAPNSPDTISSISYKNIDPFIIEKSNVILVNSENYLSGLYKDVLIIFVPDFMLNGEAILLNNNKIEQISILL